MDILNKIGKNKKLMEILKSYSWKGTYKTLATQKLRKSLSKDVSLILFDYCNKNGIDVTVGDFLRG